MRTKKSPRRRCKPAGERAAEFGTNDTNVMLPQFRRKINRGRES